MPNPTLLEKYARLCVRIGANVKKDQPVVIRATTETKDFVREVTKQAYLAGAKRVFVNWSDDHVSRLGLEHMSLKTLTDIPEWLVQQGKYAIDVDACFISVTSPVPGLNAGIDPNKLQQSSLAMMKKLAFMSDHMMSNKTQWSVAAVPNAVWAKKIFPEKSEEEAMEALWHAIFKACRVREDNDPIAEWEAHSETLARRNAVLNAHRFDALHFKNALGTDLTVGLIENHVWTGGAETTAGGHRFNPNIPTEETFTMPHKMRAEGKVVATKPLNYQGRLIEGFHFVFKDGEVVDYGAEKEEAALKNLLEFDEGSRRLGEVALISHDSPISNADILFLNTLFDENASCHLALGRAYPMNVEGGTNMEKEALEALGVNHSMAHVDFMFGSADLDVVGEKADGTRITVFKNGSFVI